MKKIILTAGLVLIGFVGIAQESDYKQDVIKLMKIQSGSQFEVLVEQFGSNVPDRNKAAFKSEMKAEMEDLYSKLAEVYMEAYTKDDIDKMLAFYNTPVGKKIQEKTPEITEKSAQIGQQWGMQVQPIMMKYMQQ